MRFILDDCADFNRQLTGIVVAVRPVMTFVSKEELLGGKEPEQEMKKADDGQLLHRWEIHVPWIDAESEYAAQEAFKAKVFVKAGTNLAAQFPVGSKIEFITHRITVLPRSSGDQRGYTASFAAESYRNADGKTMSADTGREVRTEPKVPAGVKG